MRSARELIELASQEPIADLLAREFNIPLKKVGSKLRSRECPHCGAGGADSVRLNVDPAKNLYFCHVCETGGDPIFLFREAYDLNAVEAAKRILGEDDESPADMERRRKRIRELEEQRRKMQQAEAESNAVKARIFTRLVEWAGTLTGDDFKRSISYLENERAISRKVLRVAWARRLLVFLPDEPGRTDAFLRSEFSTEDLLKSGILKEEGRKMGVCYRQVVTPYRGDDGRVYSAEFRYPERNPEFGAKSIRYGRAPNPWLWPGKGNMTVICEGIIDALSLRTLAFAGTIICVPGISQWRDDWNELVTGQHVRVMFDNDEEPLKDRDGNPRLDEQGNPIYPGPAAAKRLVERLKDGSRCLTAQALIPKRKGEDINDILRRRVVETP